MKLFLLTLSILGAAIALIAIKMFVIKGAEFKKQCSSVDPHTGKSIGCSCEKSGPEKCQYYEEHHGEGEKESH